MSTLTGNAHRRRLLAGASAVAVTAALAVAPVRSQSVSTFSAAAGIANPVTAAAMTPSLPGQVLTAGQTSASMAALANAGRVTTAISLARQANDAARVSAAALGNMVPNGLVTGGLVPVLNPVAAALDVTGLKTWQGANSPTQTIAASGAVDVNVKQTEARAILSWTSFNIGAKTTLTFDQTLGGSPQSDWVVLNRVVGGLDTSGHRASLDATSASQILGSIKAAGTVLLLNANGVLFGPTGQVNTRSLITTSLEFGLDPIGNLGIAARNRDFLRYGILGKADEVAAVDPTQGRVPTFSTNTVLNADGQTISDPNREGAIIIAKGAQITTGDSGYAFFFGPRVINSGSLATLNGQIGLASGRSITLRRSTDPIDSSLIANPADSSIRGFLITTSAKTVDEADYVWNTGSGLITATRGSALLISTRSKGATLQDGVVAATTSVSRAGLVRMTGKDIRLGTDSTLAVTPDSSGETIPQSAGSVAAFKVSRVDIGETDGSSRIEIASGSLLYAPGGTVAIGALPGQSFDTSVGGGGRIFVDSGAVIDAGGQKNVIVPAARSSIQISPVKGNELRDTPAYRASFLNGATVTVDPRRSGVRADGVAWIGSQLIEAGSYYEQVGVSAAELLTRGGNVTLGVQGKTDVVVRAGAKIDVSGGWVQYAAGTVKTTKLITATGAIVDIGDADPNVTYTGIADGYSTTIQRFGTTTNFSNPVIDGGTFQAAYTEGRDAGALTVKAAAIVLDGSVVAQAFTGPRQRSDAKTGSAAPSLFADARKLQAAPSQLPAGGFLGVQAFGNTGDGGGGDIRITQAAIPAGPAIYGQSLNVDAITGALSAVPERTTPAQLSPVRQNTILLSDTMLSGLGLSEVALRTSGGLDIEAGTSTTLQAGGVFTALTGRAIRVDGNVTAAGGSIALETFNSLLGSGFVPQPRAPGSFDITVNGKLSVRGRWINDFGAPSETFAGKAWLNGGSISLTGAPNAFVSDPANPATPIDVSGSILVNSNPALPGVRLDLASGGYISPSGTFDLTARGGSLALANRTTYFANGLNSDRGSGLFGLVPGFRVDANGNAGLVTNPAQINARISIDDGAVLAHGFGGGGTFALVTPDFRLVGDDAASSIAVTTGTALRTGFFAATGFSIYGITTYKTDFSVNNFVNDAGVSRGGYNAVLATNVVTLGAGQTLKLTSSQFSPILDARRIGALQGLPSGADLYSVETPAVPVDAYDRRGIALTFGGLTELDIAPEIRSASGGLVQAAGQIIGDAGAALTVGKLFNDGRIRLAGGTVTQSELLPSLYNSDATVVAAASLGALFTNVQPNGTIVESTLNDIGITRSDSNALLTYGQIAATRPVYLLGTLGRSEGIRLGGERASGANRIVASITDLSGAVLVNPRTTARSATDATPIVAAIVVGGGTLQSQSFTTNLPSLLNTPTRGIVGFNYTSGEGATPPSFDRAGRTLVAATGARIDVSGNAANVDQRQADGALVTVASWSDAGSLILGSGGSLTGASVRAAGGAAVARGGTLEWLDPILVNADSGGTARNVVAADIMAAGFDTFVARGNLGADSGSTVTTVNLTLGRGFYLRSRSRDGVNTTATAYTPTIDAIGNLRVAAPYIRFDSIAQAAPGVGTGATGTGTASFTAGTLANPGAIDIGGAIVFGPSVAKATLATSGDLRLIGANAIDQTLVTGVTTANSLKGQLVVNGDLALTAAQVYPTTGSTFAIVSTGADAKISIGRSSAADPATPYSAGGALTIQAANIDQGGVIRAPLGTLRVGGRNALALGSLNVPATVTVRLLGDSITSVSANGVSIPYGTTTDGIEYFFTPTIAAKLTAAPAAVLAVAGSDVGIASGARIDISGGGDVYAYEFVPGTGGSRDVLDRFAADPFSSNANPDGSASNVQYPDGRQVYAIVPGLRANAAALYDPLYSAGYDALYGPAQSGRSVYLNGGPGLAAGWYTLMPAKYALLPGALRVVEQTSAVNSLPNSDRQLIDGSLVQIGYYGTAGSAQRDSTLRTFIVQPQSVLRKYSNIVLTSGTQSFRELAAKNNLVAPRLPVDAGRLILEPLKSLALNGAVSATAASGGRGAIVDISGTAIDIVASAGQVLAGAGTDDIKLTADSLNALGAASLLIGGVRSDQADGTSTLAVSARSIIVANAGKPLAGSEIVLATDGAGSVLDLRDGAALVATGTAESSIGNYVIDGATGNTGAGAFVRVAQGSERLLTRKNVQEGLAASLLVGAVTLGGSGGGGTATVLDSSALASIDAKAILVAATSGTDALALGAGRVIFAATTALTDALLVAPALEANIAAADRLTIRTPAPIEFSGGTHSFGDLKIDAPGFKLATGSAIPPTQMGSTDFTVNINTKALTLGNSGADAGVCGALNRCGNGSLVVNAASIGFVGGVLHTYGLAGGTTLTATGGITYRGIGGFDVASGTLTLNTPFIADKADAVIVGTEATLPRLELAALDVIGINGTAGSSAAAVAGTPGAALVVTGGSRINVAGTRLRATAGNLELNAATGIIVSDGAVVETPGYARTFGDSADAYTVTAPAGRLQLATLGGFVVTLPGTRLSVGGTQGRGGAITLSAPGFVSIGGNLDASAPQGGGSLKLDSGGSFDLSAFAVTAAANGFTGALDIRTGEGGLLLAPGQTLKAERIALTAEGRDGFAIDPTTGLRAFDANKQRIVVPGAAVDIAGTIIASGANGGAITLYGGKGVVLRSTAMLDAHADGYAATDTRPARGGSVTLGAGADGTLTAASGAIIDVSARRPADRLVPLQRNGVTYYTYVGADVGGDVILRTPFDTKSGLLDINFDGTVTGASHLTLEAYRVFDLAAVAANTRLTGVNIANGTATLDVGQTITGKRNFLSATGAGTLVDFIQKFDVSASIGRLGSFASTAGFRARPGVQLDFGGNITLASNWNFGAGTVDIPAAVAAGDLQVSGLAAGKYFVTPGKEADIFANYTRLLYRVCNADCVAGVKPGSRLGGEPGVLTLRAAGNLTINGDISDGFFAFRDQTDVDYLTRALGGGARKLGLAVQLSAQQIADTSVTWVLNSNIPDFANYAEYDSQSPRLFAPYSALANAPASRGSLPVTRRSGTGDPTGTAELFPLRPNGESVDSWSYRFVAGASTTASPISVDPSRPATAGTGTFALVGTSGYSFAPASSTIATAFDGNPAKFILTEGGPAVAGANLLDEFLAAYPDRDGNSLAYISFPVTRKTALYAPLAARARSFFDRSEITFDSPPRQNNILLVTTTVARATAFLAASAADIGKAATDPRSALRPLRIGQIDPNSGAQAGFRDTATGSARHLIRSGTGSIDVVAATNIDLRNGAVPRLVGDVQTGGAAIYTAGHHARFTARTAVDTAGVAHAIDASAYVGASTFAAGDAFTTPTLGAPADYVNGFVSNYRQNFKLLANPVYAEGGGDVALTAGGNILGRRDASIEAPNAGDTVRIGRVGQSDAANLFLDNDARINSQQFADGVGTLGGGNIRVTARRDISELTVSALTSAATAGVDRDTGATRALWEVGGGDIVITTGGNLGGGLVDAGRGSVRIDVTGDIRSAGPITIRQGNQLQQLDNSLRLRIANAAVQVTAGGAANLYGIAALGAATSGLNGRANYSAIAGVGIVANGRITVENGQFGANSSDVLGATSSNAAVAIYPGSFEAVSLTGNLSISPATRAFVSMVPRSDGVLRLFAGGDINAFALAMEDADPGQLPGYFSSFSATAGSAFGRGFDFPAVLPDTTDAQRRTFHANTPVHTGDSDPVRIFAGGDINRLIVNLPKQARIGAGRDIINMVFTGQNLPGADTSRVTAGRDIIATTSLVLPISTNSAGALTVGTPLAAVDGNSFTIGGGGRFILEAGRDAGPFLNSAITNGLKTGLAAVAKTGVLSFGGGILSIGNDANPALGPDGSDVTVMFGVAKGVEYAALRETYLNPANITRLPDELFVQKSDVFGNKSADRNQPVYGPLLINWVRTNAAAQLSAKYGSTDISYAQAYDVFAALPALTQRLFLVKGVYFNELQQTSIPDSPSYLKYSRAYQAINTLFPGANGYTANNLSGGTAGATTRVQTGNLDLRLATLQTQRGGDITILGPGGKVLGGSTVRTADQAARRAYDGGRLLQGVQSINVTGGVPTPSGIGTLFGSTIAAIPTGYEGILTLRGGQIASFTDGDLLLNQSRLFSQGGGDITLFSGNGDLNAGQGPKTSANFPPVVVRIDADGNSRVDAVGGVAGAGIAAFQPAVGLASPNVYLIAPRGTVDAGDAGVRVAGNLFIAAQAVANADNFSVGGKSFGIPQAATVDVGAAASAGAAAAAIAQAASGTGDRGRTLEDVLSRITVEVLGYAGSADPCDKTIEKRPATCPPVK